ncbi:hypothetical protein BH11BAC7_BH11BAC7_11940 [soil metagenome]
METSDDFDQQLQTTKGQGQKLDEETKSELEMHTGTDLSAVNIHKDSQAHNMSESINAKAFAHGQDIYFKEGNYNPQSEEGKSLLAHEVAHTVQDGNSLSSMASRFPDSDTDNFVLTFLGKASVDENGKIKFYYRYEIAYKKSFSYEDFMLLFLQDIFSLDDTTTQLLVDDIKARQAKRNQTYQQYWEGGTFAGLTYTNTAGEPQKQKCGIIESEYYVLLAFLGLPVPAKTEDYSSTMQEILNSDPGKLPAGEQENRKKLIALIKMISPDEWGLGTGADLYGFPDEMMIEQIEKYIKYRREVWTTLQSAIDKNDALLASTTINEASNQVIVSFTLEQRLAYIRLIANGKEVTDGASAIIRILQTAPEGQFLGLLDGLAANKSELLVLLNTAMKDKMAEYMNVLRAMVFYAKSGELLSLLVSSASAKPDAKKIFPWNMSTSTLKNMIMPGWEFNYKSSIGSEGKVSLEYEWFTATSYTMGGGPMDATTPTQTIIEYHFAREQDPQAVNDPEKYGFAELDPFELIILEVRTSSSRVGFQEGQLFIVPAIMMPYIIDEVNWETIVNALTFAANAVLFAVGIGEVMAAKSVIQVIVGIVNALVGAIGMVRPEIEKLNGGKDFLAYYDIFVLLQASYYGGKLLLKLPELYAGVVKTWQMVKLANAGDQTLLKLATISTEVGSLDAQLKAYLEALDGSKRANAQWRIAVEEAKLDLRIGTKLFSITPLTPIGIVAGLIGKGIQLGFLRARATVAEIRAYLEMQGVLKELGALSSKEIDDLIAKAQTEAVATEVNAMKQTVQGLGRVRTGKPNYSEWQPLNDEEIIVFTKNPDSTNAFFVRTEGGKDLITYGNVPTPRPSKSVSMGVTLDVDEEVSTIFSRKNGLAEPGDVLYATTVRQVRGAGFDVVYHPTPNNNWHASIVENTSEKAAKFAIPEDVNKLRQIFILIQKK